MSLVRNWYEGFRTDLLTLICRGRTVSAPNPSSGRRRSRGGVAVIGGIYAELLFAASFHESEGASEEGAPL